MIPIPNPLTQPLQYPPRPLEIPHLEIDLPTKPNPPRPRIKHHRHKRIKLLHHPHNQPLRHPRHIPLPDLPPPLPHLQRQPDIRKAAPRQPPLPIIQHLRPQRPRDRDAARLDHIGAVAHDGLLPAAHVPPERERLGDAQVRRVVHGADELELRDEGALAAGRERVVDRRLAGDGGGLEAVRGG